MIKPGDRVTGTPLSVEQLKLHPTVTGAYEKVPWTFMGEKNFTEFVNCGGISVACVNIRTANRREKDTVL